MPFVDTMPASVVARFPDRFRIGYNGGKAVLRACKMMYFPHVVRLIVRRNISGLVNDQIIFGVSVVRQGAPVPGGEALTG